ncbi:Fe-S cluster assembly protein SufD [Serinibacter arcticus]|uniref:Fe-S cluster assembly protein SufD n=1 Tax=Serinibacter arcticus TaxID=1655435 RepID=A0A2U1ZSK6_9MICO|nr:Fe-S cluster assembly protein SufD [Serinibacter arcticus]PWD49967.1 Fe-S cluster assembly protein SufD [Serinibacter arcticus]
MAATTTELTTDHSRASADAAHSHGGPAAPEASRASRFASFDIADFPAVTGAEEEWRFSPVDRLQRLIGGTATGTVTVDVTAPEGVGVAVTKRDGASTTGVAGVPNDQLAATAWGAALERTEVTIGANAEPTSETTVVVRGEAGSAAAASHLLVTAQHHSKALVVVDHVGTAELAQTVEIDVHDGAHLTVVSIQDWDRGTVHGSSHRARLGRDATLKHIVVSLGGDVVRVTVDGEFTQPGAMLESIGLYYADAGQHLEHRLFVDHAVPRCTSRVTYKGALQGVGARSVWIGDVLIRKAAEGTDTYELNRNLVLTEGARADSVPNLEIETGEIEGAGHASATGRFDDEQLFYLKSRGIPEDVARRLVVRGFFAELIQQIGVPAVEQRLEAAIEAELEVTGL